MILASIIFVVVTSYTIYTFYTRRKAANYLRERFNVPPTFRFRGHFPHFPKDFPGIFDKTIELIRGYGKNVLFMGPFYLTNVIISNPVDVEVLLSYGYSKPVKKSTEYDFLRPWLGKGLLTGKGKRWRQIRDTIEPNFHENILGSFTETINRQTNIFIKKLDPHTSLGDFNVSNYISLLALDIIWETVMGNSIDAQSQPDSEYVHTIQTTISLIYKRIFNSMQRLTVLFMLSREGWKHRSLVKNLQKITLAEVTKRREMLACKSNSKINFLDTLLKAEVDGKPLKDAEIREEVDTLIFTGYETIASALMFTFYQLSKNQDVQEKIFKEACDLHGHDPSTEISFERLKEFQYLDMVIKETLRIAPPVPFIGRQQVEATETVSDKVDIPAGTNLTIAVYSMHHDPDNFPNPEKFDPERFRPGILHSRHPFAYLPFGDGSRNCIGRFFAMFELKTIILKTIVNYRILPTEVNGSVQVQSALILKPSDGVEIRLKRR